MREHLFSGYFIHKQQISEKSILSFFFTETKGKIAALSFRQRSRKSSDSLVMVPGFLLEGRIVYKPHYRFAQLARCEIPILPEKLPCFHEQGQILYLNQMIYSFLEEENPYPQLYELYKNAVTHPERADTCKLFEWGLLSALGYGVLFPNQIRAELTYQFRPSIGMIEAQLTKEEGDSSPILLTGTIVQQLKTLDFHDPIVAKLAEKIFWEQLRYHLPSKKLQAFPVIFPSYGYDSGSFTLA